MNSILSRFSVDIQHYLNFANETSTICRPLFMIRSKCVFSANIVTRDCLLDWGWINGELSDGKSWESYGQTIGRVIVRPLGKLCLDHWASYGQSQFCASYGQTIGRVMVRPLGELWLDHRASYGQTIRRVMDRVRPLWKLWIGHWESYTIARVIGKNYQCLFLFKELPCQCIIYKNNKTKQSKKHNT